MELQTLKNRFGIIGNAPALNYALSVAERVASTDLTVLITGESGTGKEIFSQIIHSLSARKHNPFIAVNCGAIPEGTIDSELFGHEKGSFTGATDKRKGYFETVDKGTIFLDEIGEMPLGTQARLLRLLQNGELIKVGSSVVQKTDVRVVAATNVNLAELVRKGKFREDLYYRLNTVPIEVPPLRERGDDIILLFKKFASDFAEKNKIDTIKLDETAKQLLLKYRWPGNIRQLKNVAEQATILSPDRIVSYESLIRFLPDAHEKLPMYQQDKNGYSSDFNERELLYKILFDLKADMREIKQFLTGRFHPENPEENAPFFEDSSYNLQNITPLPASNTSYVNAQNIPVILGPSKNVEIKHAEAIEENLSLIDMEKEYIVKALKKHRNKRKNAALDLGISERTLYRKILEYDIKEQ